MATKLARRLATGPAAGAPSRRPREIYEHLRQQIEEGEFPVGVPFPTEERLCASENVSRYALREALAMLEAEGLIRRRRGSGTQVVSRTPVSVFRHASGSRAELLNYVAGTRVEWQRGPMLRTDGTLARLLGCEEFREWQFLSGVRRDDRDDPVALVRVYVDPVRAAIPTDADLSHGPIYEWVEQHHRLRAKMLSQDIRAKSLTAEEAAALSDKPGASVLEIVRRYFDANNLIFLISVTVHRSRDFVYNQVVQLQD